MTYKIFVLVLICLTNFWSGVCFSQAPAKSYSLNELTVIKKDFEERIEKPAGNMVSALTEASEIALLISTIKSDERTAKLSDLIIKWRPLVNVLKEVEKLASLDCTKQFREIEALSKIFRDKYYDATGVLNIAYKEIEYKELYDSFKLTTFDENDCRESINKENIARMLTKINELNEFIEEEVSRYNITANSVLDLLKKRNDILQNIAIDAITKDKIAGILPWLMLIVLGFSIVILGGTRIFEFEIQKEWIVSGQVIQFVTVMVLLSILLVLGMSSVLEGETVGTLLGGLAGYVLAQGVGRSSVRDANRQVEAWVKGDLGGLGSSSSSSPTPKKPAPPATPKGK